MKLMGGMHICINKSALLSHMIQIYSKRLIFEPHLSKTSLWGALVLDGMENFDRNGRTNNSPIEQRWLFLLLFSPFFRFDEAEEPLLEVPIGGPYRN